MGELAARVDQWLKFIFDVSNKGYTSLIFFICLIVFLGIYFLLRSSRVRRIWILIGGLFFYLWAGGLAALMVICVTVVIVYLISRRMENVYNRFEVESKELPPKERTSILTLYKKKTRAYLILAVILIVAVWVYSKIGRLMDLDVVTGFQNFNLLTSVIVPLGISYYSLSCIGYLMDVYWRKTKPDHNFLTLAAVVTYFPHIVQGPISKYSNLLEQMNHLPGFDYKRVCYGFQLMLWGYIKKMVIADRLALYTSTVFDTPADFAGVEILLAVIFCIFQLYADFSGCMDIVRGISQAMGIELERNFKQPLFAKSASEFWRRWHITLGAWMREYIYFPISTNPRFIRWISRIKKSGRIWAANFLKTLIPMIVVWLLTGLWHGTGLDYIVWGLYWCTLIVLSVVLKPITDKVNTRLSIKPDNRLFHFWQSLRTCIYFSAGRMFTVAGGLAGCGILWRQLFANARLWTLFDGSLYTHGLDQRNFYVALIGIILMVVVDIWHEKGINIRGQLAMWPLPFRWMVYYGAVFAVVIFGTYGSGYNASVFIYQLF